MYLFQKIAATGFSYLMLTSRCGALREICIIKQIFMRFLLKTEEATQLAIAIFALYYQPIHFAWWLWPILFLLPDLSMAGYLINNRAGAVFYNVFHYKAIAGLLILSGFAYVMPALYFAGLLLWAHSSFDRMMGYGLKYPDSFNHTHLGNIGKQKVA